MKRTLLACLVGINLLFADPAAKIVKEQVVSVLPTLQGWCTKEKAQNFIDFIMSEKPDVWVEIGVFGGSSLFPVASAFKFLGKGTVIAIDPWDKFECIRYFDPIRDSADLRWWGNVNMNQVYATFTSMLKTYDLTSYCKTIRATSENAIKEIEAIDVLHIDGNHSDEASIRDVELYLPKVRSGGFIWMNDSLWPQRQNALDLLLAACDVVKVIDNGNCILFKKR